MVLGRNGPLRLLHGGLARELVVVGVLDKKMGFLAWLLLLLLLLLFVGLMLLDDLFDADALVLGLALCLDLLDLLVVREVLEVFRVGVRLVRLRLGSRVELFWRSSEASKSRCVGCAQIPKGALPSWCRKNSAIQAGLN